MRIFKVKPLRRQTSSKGQTGGGLPCHTSDRGAGGPPWLTLQWRASHEAGERREGARLVYGHEFSRHIETVAPPVIERERVVFVAVGWKREAAQFLFVGFEIHETLLDITKRDTGRRQHPGVVHGILMHNLTLAFPAESCQKGHVVRICAAFVVEVGKDGRKKSRGRLENIRGKQIENGIFRKVPTRGAKPFGNVRETCAVRTGGGPA